MSQLPARIIQFGFIPVFNQEAGYDVCCTTGFEMLFEEFNEGFLCEITMGLFAGFVLTAGLVIWPKQNNANRHPKDEIMIRFITLVF